MDYEKKYNEALNDMRVIYPNLKGDAKLAVEHAFPELRESEDERIRMSIYHTIEQCSDILAPENQKRMLAYLEKQKSIYDEWAKDREGCFWDGVAEGRRQKEQKQETLTEGAKEYTIREDYTSAYYEQKGYSRGYADGKRDAEQKPAEWSEEDEKIRGNLMSLLANMRGDRITEETYQKYYPWLKSLRPQPKRDGGDDYNKGYNKGYKDAEEAHKKSVAYHYPTMPQTPSGWGCDGTHCTNPHYDCINCPRKTTGGMFTTPNTASGTSTLKAEG